MILFLCALAGFFVAQAVKDTLAYRVKNYTKLFLVLVGSTVVSSAFYSIHSPLLEVYGVAGAGLAILVHRLVRLLGAVGDWFIINVMKERPKR